MVLGALTGCSAGSQESANDISPGDRISVADFVAAANQGGCITTVTGEPTRNTPIVVRNETDKKFLNWCAEGLTPFECQAVCYVTVTTKPYCPPGSELPPGFVNNCPDSTILDNTSTFKHVCAKDKNAALDECTDNWWQRRSFEETEYPIACSVWWIDKNNIIIPPNFQCVQVPCGAGGQPCCDSGGGLPPYCDIGVCMAGQCVDNSSTNPAL
jgi:hypothetical protein